jgi:protein HIRA/HIR1
LSSRDVKKQSINFPPSSLLPLLNSPGSTVVIANVRPNGAPIIHCSQGVAYSYDAALCTWTKLSDIWYSEGSDVWQGRQRHSSIVGARGVVSGIESTISASCSPPEDSAEKQRPKWWSTAVTLSHLETKLHSAKILDSPIEYKQALLVYAKKIADEGFRAKAEELIKELFGPVYRFACPLDISDDKPERIFVVAVPGKKIGGVPL